jgi:hypothetical protein
MAKLRVHVAGTDSYFVSDDEEGLWLALEPTDPYEITENSIDICVASGQPEEQAAQLRHPIAAAEKAIAELKAAS